MAHSKVAEQHMTNKILECPRDRTLMTENVVGESILDTCGKCGGQFFDTGEMFGSFGMKADPSLWDREETAGPVREGSFKCPRCNKVMLTQDIKHEATKVEIDRCGHCGGIWLDKGEVDQIMSIGEKMAPVIEAEKAKAKAELDKMGDVDFNPGLIARFLARFKKKPVS
jgi:Zn-finger nucleic acid-binding protein